MKSHRTIAWALAGLLCAAVAATDAAAQDAPVEIRSIETQELEIPTAPVIIDGHLLFYVRGSSAFPAADRAAAIAGRIRSAAADSTISTDQIGVVSQPDVTIVTAGPRRLLQLFDADAAVESISRAELGTLTAERIQIAISAYRADRSLQNLQSAGLSAAIASIVFAALVWLTLRTLRWLMGLIEVRFRQRVRSVGIGSFNILERERIWSTVEAVLQGLRVLLLGAMIYFYTQFVLGLFPWTRRVSIELLDYVIDPLRTIAQGFIDEVPSVIFLIVLFLFTRIALRLIRLFFDAVESGSVALREFEPEWAEPTYRVIRIGVIAFALVIAYPYIPGSESDAFKGVSIFLGVLFSIGSSSFVSNFIAGYAITYRRVFKVGHRVKVDDIVGDVVEIRLQVTHLRSLKNEEVIIPNSEILNRNVTNYSTFAKKGGLIVHTTVGIGYETPWRQVQAMLLSAAEQTAGLQRDPPPFVRQTALGDFCITYEINAYCDDAQAMEGLRSDLHHHILDIFNEHGVQIMTPAYEHDPEQPKLVAPDQWYLAPAAPPTPAAP